MRPDAPYFIILLCLMPDDFTRQGKNTVTQWLNFNSIVAISQTQMVVEQSNILICIFYNALEISFYINK
jgi:hypothetical protein